jgi:streptomycin 3"-adenylyltransferase
MLNPSRVDDSYAGTLAEILACLPDDVAACYLYGSATDGGLRPNSDIDVLVVLQRPLAPSERSSVVRRLLALSGPSTGPVRPIEAMFVLASDVHRWSYPPRRQLLFGEWLRDRFERDDIPEPAADPDLAILLHAARRKSRPLIGPEARTLIAPVPVQAIRDAIVDSLPKLLDDLKGDERNVVLTLARMWTTLASDEVVPKDVAAAWVLERIPPEHRMVLELARDAYLGRLRDDWADHQPEVKQFAAYTASVIQALYRERTAGP